jgi:hypothetical protein
MINGIFRDLLDEGVIAYLDDILIYSEDEESHIDLVRRVNVLERLNFAQVSTSQLYINTK